MLLFKYRSWNDWTKEILTECRLFYPNKNLLNDPAEIIHPIRFDEDFFSVTLENARSKQDPASIAKILDIEQALSRAKAERVLMRYSRAKNPKKYPENPLDKYLDQPVSLDSEVIYDLMNDAHEALETYAISLAEDTSLLYINKVDMLSRLNKRLLELGILSLSANGNSLVMWAHYADMNNGIILIFDTERDDLLKKAKKITYQTNRPIITPDNIIDVLYTKNTNWSYEEEYRVLVKTGNHSYPFDKDALIGIIIGSRMNESSIKDLIDLLNTLSYSLKLYISSPSSDAYEMIYTQIQY